MVSFRSTLRLAHAMVLPFPAFYMVEHDYLEIEELYETDWSVGFVYSPVDIARDMPNGMMFEAHDITYANTEAAAAKSETLRTIIDAPGHRDFIKNMITGASQADVALIMVPADGNFTTAIARGDHKAGEIQGQTRQHSRLINLLGVKQICIGVNKMDCDAAAYKQSRYDEIANEMKSTLAKVGWKKDLG